GAYITFMRKSYIDKILEICNENHKEISKGKETLTLKYQFFEESTDTEFLSDINECKKRLLLKIQENTEEDIRTCISNIGPHRDDIDILINEKSARMFASQGQQRSAVLSMKLAEADMIYYSSGEQPVMLLDDIFSELDKSRQNYILKKIKDRQVILTSCDKGKYRSLKDSAFFKMDNGNLSSLF
ncbi:MAG: DNA replication and repair protein RecF, partial [Bacillota bacterium]|nr:DNA replication and repair protein RecF [Bacillota bacterium]